jgi:hypothetical protein
LSSRSERTSDRAPLSDDEVVGGNEATCEATEGATGVVPEHAGKIEIAPISAEVQIIFVKLVDALITMMLLLF